MHLVTHHVEHAMSICTVPQDILAKQAMIETVPDIMLLILLVSMLTISIVTYSKWSKYLNAKELLVVVPGLSVVTISIWIWGSHVLTRVITCLANPEYAALLKFAMACTK